MRDRDSKRVDSVTVDGWSHLSPSRLLWLPLLQFALEGLLHCLFQQPQTEKEKQKTNTENDDRTVTKLNAD